MKEQCKKDNAEAAEQPKDNAEAAEQPKESEASFIIAGIAEPGQNDVQFGRGGDTSYHIGNIRFRHFCGLYKKKYQTTPTEGRHVLVQEIIDGWRSQNPPGRFLARTDPGDKEMSVWHDVGDEAALKKTVKVLGEGLGEKRQQKKARNSTALSAPKGQAGLKQQGEVAGLPNVDSVRVAAVASDEHYVSADLLTSPDSSKLSLSNSYSALGVDSFPLQYNEGHGGITLMENESCHEVFRTLAAAPCTPKSTPKQCVDCPSVELTRESFGGGQTQLNQMPQNSHKMQWRTALGMHIPDAASLTGVFGSNDHGSSPDSGDEKPKHVLGTCPQQGMQFMP